jgi:hypothetical protein
MTFQSNFSHTEKIFIDLQILNLSKSNNYLTSLFMFRYHHLNNSSQTFLFQITKFTSTTLEIQLNFINLIRELTTSSTRFQ